MPMANTAPTADQLATFPQSVASGDPTPHGIVLWTRVAVAPAPQPVHWQVAADDSFAAILVEGSLEPDAAHDFTIKPVVDDEKLAPFTRYAYRFLYNGVTSRTGYFKTLPEDNADLAELKLAYVVCQDYGNGFYTALAGLAEEDVDYVIHLGDYIYETITATAFQSNPARVVPPFPSGSVTVPVNIDDYRHLYKVYRSDPNQQLVHERFAYIQLWDDHEFANDCHQDFHPDNNTAPLTALTPQPALRQEANQAWAEYGLANTPFDPTQDWEHSIRVYRKLAFGTLADLIITDERLYRDRPPCGPKEYGERYFTLGCDEIHDPNRTMLGVPQREWFIDKVVQSHATWKLWANEVMLMQLKATAVYVDLDQWDGYPAERAAILSAVSTHKVQNFVALTGDIHTFITGYLKTNFSDPFEHPMGIELVVGSISSANFKEEIESDLHLTSAPVPAKQFHTPADQLDPLIRLLNPHIEYWNSDTHGYGILTLTPAHLVCEFKAVSTVREPVAEVKTLKVFTIKAGQTHLHEGHPSVLDAIKDGLDTVFGKL